MKKVHFFGVPCGSKESGITYSHVTSLVTCDKCLGKDKVVVEKEEKADDKRRNSGNK